MIQDIITTCDLKSKKKDETGSVSRQYVVNAEKSNQNRCNSFAANPDKRRRNVTVKEDLCINTDLFGLRECST